MDEGAIRHLLTATREEVLDDDGQPIGCITRPARFKLDHADLARGGFLVVERDEETGEYVGTVYDALPHPRTKEPYPAGYSEQAWRTADLEEAVRRVRQSLGTAPET